MRLDLVHPAAEKITLVLEGIGDDKIRINSSSLSFPFTSRLPACQRDLHSSHPDTDGIHQCSAAADSGAVYRPRDRGVARCVAMKAKLEVMK
jgi:hypothetical protein